MEHYNLCGATNHTGKDCMAAVPKDFPINLCMKHLRLAGEFYVEVKDVLRLNSIHAVPEKKVSNEFVYKDRNEMSGYPGESKDTGLVYYILFGDMIKIGYSASIETRLASLPWEECLAFEPGSFALENSRHKKFSQYKLKRGREWFSDCKPLRDHIAKVREQWPHLTRLADKYTRGERKNFEAPMEEPPVPHDTMATLTSGMKIRNLDRTERKVRENHLRKYAGARFPYEGE